ncbi:flagellar hook-length control protein FliK [Brevundimonas balnearis]|uniref:Flagellar hook-length control protein FliK n=1 Tax=Brevundimonas balnearis TaxID=1572858 RepID=A0ABV6R0D6_9CAUL
MSDVAFALQTLLPGAGPPGAWATASADAEGAAGAFASALAAQTGSLNVGALVGGTVGGPTQVAPAARASAAPSAPPGKPSVPGRASPAAFAEATAPAAPVAQATAPIETPVSGGVKSSIADAEETPDPISTSLADTVALDQAGDGALASQTQVGPRPAPEPRPAPAASVTPAGTGAPGQPAPEALAQAPRTQALPTDGPAEAAALQTLEETPRPATPISPGAGLSSVVASTAPTGRRSADAASLGALSTKGADRASEALSADDKRPSVRRAAQGSSSAGMGETASLANAVAAPSAGPAGPAGSAPGAIDGQRAQAPVEAASPLDPAALETSADEAAASGSLDGESSAPGDVHAPDARVADPGLHGRLNAIAQISAQILRRIEGNATRFEVALTPEDLGRVDVSLEIDAEGSLVARLAFDNPAAAAELRGQADQLRRELESAGLQLARDALEFTERRDGDGSQRFDRRGSRAFAGAVELAAEIDAPPAYQSSMTPRGVDLRV